MATKGEGKGERRRRIMSRESDRMAVITGRLRNLPPSPPPSPSSPATFLFHHRGRSHTGISPSFFSKDLHKDPDAPPINQIEANSKAKDENIGFDDEVQRGYQIKHQFQTLDPIGEIKTPTIPTPSALSKVQNPSIIEEEPQMKTHPFRPKLFTSKRINSCILASQTTRALSSLIIALLVVLSYIDLPIVGRNIVRSESVVASKPVYILLLTDVTIVVARMILERQKEAEEEEEREVRKEDGQNWDSAVKMLERGLVVYQAFRAIFIDFSVYAVVVICGLSFV